MNRIGMNIFSRIQLQKEKLYFKIKKNITWNLISVILYKTVLDLSYYFVISQVVIFSRFEIVFNGFKLAESYLLVFFVYIIMPKSSKKLSNILIWLLILISYIPMLTIFAFKDESRIYMYAVTAFWIVVFFVMRVPMPDISLRPLKQSRIIFYSLFAGMCTAVIFMIYKYLGISFNYDFTKVYDIRSLYFAAEIPFAGYLFNWVANIVNPLFFILFIIKRKWFLVIFIVVFQILLFSVTGLKSFLFALPFVLALMWIIKRSTPIAYIGFGLAGIVLLGILSYWLIDDIWISSLFARRTLLSPAQLSFFYYDFFSKHEFVFLSASRLSYFINYPYHLSPPHLIADVYYNQPAMSANTGVVGDAYMNFGFIGLAIYGILLAGIMRLVDFCSKMVDLRIGIAAIAMIAISLTNSALSTCLLTHGLLLALLLLYLLPREQDKFLK